MGKKKKAAPKAAIVVQGEILPVWNVKWIEDAGEDVSQEGWTHGPILPVAGNSRPAPSPKRGKRGGGKRA